MKLRLAVLLVIITALFSSGALGQGVAMTASGDSIAYMTYGRSTTTLVLVHGWTNNRTFWEPHIPRLSERYRVVTLDLASFGESSTRREDWSMRSFALDIDAVLDQLDAKEAIVVGFSMGGAASIELAALGRDDVIGVVLVDVLQDVEARPDDQYIESFINAYRDSWHDPKWVRSDGFSETTSETLIRRYLSRTPETVPDVWWSSARNFWVWVRDDLRSTLSEVNVPISAINSDLSPTNVEAWRRYVPDFNVHLLEGVGHLGAIWERIDEFDSALIGFVEEYRRRARN